MNGLFMEELADGEREGIIQTTFSKHLLVAT